MKKYSRIAVFGVNAVLALGFGFFWVKPALAIELVKSGGCWLTLITVVVFGWALLRVIGRSSHAWMRDRGEWGALLSVPAGCAMLLSHEPRGFKIIMDEIMLLGTSMSMHFQRLVEVPLRGNDLNGAFEIVDGFVDKRPIFFPFLLSLVHDAKGYRPENAFLLNTLLTVALLIVVYVLARTLAGRWAAVGSVLLLGGLPLLAQNATGGGFDLLNLVMIGLTLWLALRFSATHARMELTALLLAVTLLAQTRYESVLFCFPVAILVVWVWWQEREVILSWTATLVPLLLLPVPWLFGVFDRRPGSWEIASQTGAGSPIDFSYVASNLTHARAFFFDRTGQQPNSLLFSALGVVALVGLFAWIVWASVWRKGAFSPTRAATLLFAGALLAHLALMMTYFWGKFDDPVISRLSLPTHLLFLVALWLVVPSDAEFSRRVWIGITVLAAVQFWRISVPVMVNHAYTHQNVHTREVEWRRTLMAEKAGKEILVIDPYSIVWLTHRISGTWPAQVREHPDALAFHLRMHSFNEVLVFQRFEIDEATGKETLLPDFDLGPDFVLERVAERRLQPFVVSRVSRVVAVVPHGKKPSTP